MGFVALGCIGAPPKQDLGFDTRRLLHNLSIGHLARVELPN